MWNMDTIMCPLRKWYIQKEIQGETVWIGEENQLPRPTLQTLWTQVSPWLTIRIRTRRRTWTRTWTSKPDKSGRSQRKHSFETNPEKYYISHGFPFLTYNTYFTSKVTYRVSPKKSWGNCPRVGSSVHSHIPILVTFHHFTTTREHDHVPPEWNQRQTCSQA